MLACDGFSLGWEMLVGAPVERRLSAPPPEVVITLVGLDFGLSNPPAAASSFLIKEPHSQPGEAHGHCWFVGLEYVTLHETTPPGRERSVSEWRDMPRSSAKAAHDDGCVPVLSNAHPTCEIPVWPVRWRVARVWGPGRSQDARDGGPVR